jgi:hypothetical protein
VAVIILAAATFAHSDFGLGLSAGDIAHTAAVEAVRANEPPAANTLPKPPTSDVPAPRQ